MKIKELEIADQDVWFTQNRRKKYRPVTTKGWIAILIPLVIFFCNIVFSIILITISEGSGIDAIIRYLVVLFIGINAFFTVYAVNQVTVLTGQKYKK
jgi:glucan phosphoethanolaminetransferase (alkaline phosphatase superfamily)